ncbi:mannose-specific lectin-like [Sebastes umbrosus]|uniref:mannose-specific lectin-like n=1 Tax=Sebastes umbrosus TaxID=72105 RepID=UPI0018A0F9BD|nr:mannose-specific lectin-like [Sebastes umbrosus]
MNLPDNLIWRGQRRSGSLQEAPVCMKKSRNLSKNSLSKDEELRRGDSLVSDNGKFKAVFQEDGNFVLYSWKPLWASDTSGTDAIRLRMQADCNLVMYNGSSEPRWHTNSVRGDCDICCLHLSDEGRLEVQEEGYAVWKTDRDNGKK